MCFVIIISQLFWVCCFRARAYDSAVALTVGRNGKFLPLIFVVLLLKFTKFGQNRSNICEIIACDDFENGGRLLSGICGANSGTIHRENLVHGLYNCAKFGWNRFSSFDNIVCLNIFACLAWTPIDAPFGVFWNKLVKIRKKRKLL